jgi:hypothetical protein
MRMGRRENAGDWRRGLDPLFFFLLGFRHFLPVPLGEHHRCKAGAPPWATVDAVGAHALAYRSESAVRSWVRITGGLP